MKLTVPPTIQPDRPLRPPLNTRVSVVHAGRSDPEWPLYLRLRFDAYDLATPGVEQAPRPTEATSARLVVRQAGEVWSFPVRLEPVDGALPSWRVWYVGPPETQDVRREWRNAVDTFTGWVRYRGAEWRPTLSYDFSIRAVRFFLPWDLGAGDRVQVRWHVDQDWVEGTMRLIRREAAVVWWQQQRGYPVVGHWEEWSEAMAYRWRRYCWRHQPTISARRGTLG